MVDIDKLINAEMVSGAWSIGKYLDQGICFDCGLFLPRRLASHMTSSALFSPTGRPLIAETV
jgi:hypothetical protein